jgi:hypothetical protein
MKYDTVEDVIASFSHPVLLTVWGEPDYQTIHATKIKYATVENVMESFSHPVLP